jgi:formylglycine-generating enzyme required for sulfatase activity
MDFVLIPPGEFVMGSSQEEQARFLEVAKAVGDAWAVNRIPTEGPPHPVRISRPFYFGRYEVTQAQWEAAMGHNPSSIKAPNNPVENVSWNDARLFIERLNGVNAFRGRSARTPFDVAGMSYAFPTEAQWEYACRAGTTTTFSFGDSEETLGEYAWHAPLANEKTHPVGLLKPNAWALHDMHGNVWEWCADWFAADYYTQSPQTDPCGPPAGSTRIFRGGSWGHVSCSARSAFRRSLSPDFRYHSLGFRLALVFERESRDED